MTLNDFGKIFLGISAVALVLFFGTVFTAPLSFPFTWVSWQTFAMAFLIALMAAVVFFGMEKIRKMSEEPRRLEKALQEAVNRAALAENRASTLEATNLEKSALNERLTAEVRSYETRLTEKGLAIERLENRAKLAEERLLEAEQDVTLKDEAINSLTDDLNIQEKLATEKTRQLAEVEQQLLSTKSTLLEKNERLASLAEELARQKDHSDELEQRLQAAELRANEDRNSLEKKDMEIRRLTDDLLAAQKLVADERSKIAGYELRIRELQEANTEKSTRLEQAEKRIDGYTAFIAKQSAQIEAMDVANKSMRETLNRVLEGRIESHEVSVGLLTTSKCVTGLEDTCH